MKTQKNGFISLVGENSHKISIPPGQGSFVIGTKDISDGKYDVLVDINDNINWDCFNESSTPHGAENKEFHPYGDWPRFFYYFGNDTGFIEWSHKRHIEEFHWFLKGDMCIDLSQANINRFFIHTDKHKIVIKNITGKVSKLFLSGNLEEFQIQQCDNVPSLCFSPAPLNDKTTSYGIPHFSKLSNATSVEINSNVVGDAFDCTSLLQFQKLKSLHLTGSLTNLEALSQLKLLETISIRYSSDLSGLPHLKTWSNLERFIGWNIEQVAGKRLKLELADLMLEKQLQYSSISQLRKKTWFDTEYKLPFSAWQGKLAKTAIKAYKTSLKEIKKAKTEKEVHNFIVSFVSVFNELEGIETSERDDIGDAVKKLITVASVEILPEVWQNWFDNTRDF